MRKRALVWGINARPPVWLQWFLTLAPLVLFLVWYKYQSDIYLAENARGKLFPSYTMMSERLWSLAAFADISWYWVWGMIPIPAHITFTGNLLWNDTVISLIRLLSGLTLASVIGLVIGLNTALFPVARYLALPWIITLSFVPVVAVLPILLIALGIGEEAKVMLIFLGLVFFVTRGMHQAVREIPVTLLIKARTLGAGDMKLTYKIVLPMIMPKLLESVRLNLGTAWFCLMTGEAIAAQQGLAYRIFLFRRVGPDMAGIIPYVIWITLLAFVMYYLTMWAQWRLYPWSEGNGS